MRAVYATKATTISQSSVLIDTDLILREEKRKPTKIAARMGKTMLIARVAFPVEVYMIAMSRKKISRPSRSYAYVEEVSRSVPLVLRVKLMRT